MMATRKTSKKRQAILDALMATTEHPNAEWLYHKLKPEYPDLSLGTVYRNLSLFADAGDILRIGVLGGQERFDGWTHPHAHFICEKCGRVDDVDAMLPENRITGEMPGEVRSWALTFYGICRCCAADDHKKDKEKI